MPPDISARPSIRSTTSSSSAYSSKSAIFPTGKAKPPSFRRPRGSYDPLKDKYYTLKLLRRVETENGPAFKQVGDTYFHFHCNVLVRQLEIHYDGAPSRYCDITKGHHMYNLSLRALVNFRGRLEVNHEDFNHLWATHTGPSGAMTSSATSLPLPDRPRMSMGLVSPMGTPQPPGRPPKQTTEMLTVPSLHNAHANSPATTPRDSIARSLGMEKTSSSRSAGSGRSARARGGASLNVPPSANEEESSVSIFVSTGRDESDTESDDGKAHVEIEMTVKGGLEDAGVHTVVVPVEPRRASGSSIGSGLVFAGQKAPRATVAKAAEATTLVC